MSPSGKAWDCKSLIRRFNSGHGLRKSYICPGGGMVYTAGLRSAASNGLWVRVPPRALSITLRVDTSAMLVRYLSWKPRASLFLFRPLEYVVG